jgi:hypothetical protein
MNYYYFGGLMLRSGNPDIYNKAAYEKFYEAFPQVKDKHHMLNYPPFIYSVFAVLAPIQRTTMGCIWYILNILFMFGSMIFIYLALYRILPSDKLRELRFILYGLAFVFFSPVLETLLQGQVNALLMFLLSGTYYFYTKRNLKAAGIMLGIAVSLKIFPAFIFLLFMVRKEWKAVGWGIASIILIHIIIMLAFGAPPVTGYFANTSGSYMVFYTAMIQDNQSPVASVARLITDNPLNKPWFNAPWLVLPVRIAISILVPLILVLFTLKYGKNDNNEPVLQQPPESGFLGHIRIPCEYYLFPLFVMGIFVIAPLVWAHHLVLMLMAVPIFMEIYTARGIANLKEHVSLLLLITLLWVIGTFDGAVSPLSRPIANPMRFAYMWSLLPQLCIVSVWIMMLINSSLIAKNEK